MTKTWIVYRDGDAGTEDHLAIVTAAQYYEHKGGSPNRIFRDAGGMPVLYVANIPWIKVRALGETP